MSPLWIMLCRVFWARHRILCAFILVAPLGRYDFHFISPVHKDVHGAALCTADGLKQSEVQHRAVWSQPFSQPGPAAVVPGLTSSDPCERCLHLFVSLEIEGLIHLSRFPALCRRAAAGGKRSSRPECLPVSHIQSSGSARNNPISDIKVGECPPEAIPINLGSIHFGLIQKGMGRSCLWISNYTPHTSPLISALCTLKYYFKASLKQNAAGQKC